MPSYSFYICFSVCYITVFFSFPRYRTAFFKGFSAVFTYVFHIVLRRIFSLISRGTMPRFLRDFPPYLRMFFISFYGGFQPYFPRYRTAFFKRISAVFTYVFHIVLRRFSALFSAVLCRVFLMDFNKIPHKFYCRAYPKFPRNCL
jgi:hypothetical protein